MGEREQATATAGPSTSLRMTPSALDLGWEQGTADDGGYAGAEQFDGVREFVVGEGGDAHLEADAGDAAEGLVHLEELGGYCLGVADEERAGGAAECFELAARDRRPAALLADFGESVGVAGE